MLACELEVTAWNEWGVQKIEFTPAPNACPICMSFASDYDIAHSAIDRDNERFHEDLLEDFAVTLPGKGFFVEGHPSSWSGRGGHGEYLSPPR